ncbi:MAG: serine/threonine-protein kinase [Blastocatellia bacterium]
MKPERWQCIEDLFRTLADRPAADRGVYLACVCSGDEELEREVISLLARDTTEDFIREPIADVACSLTARPGDDLTGERIGPYRVTRLIGHGGMGVVYEAERDDRQFRQQVAIKIIRRGMDTDFVRDRFLRERQILASLDHPHIARLFDGGALPDGLPYFVMEFVAGEPITDYCRRRRLSVSEKLKIFRKVCSAVQHAHGRLVIHRDLKPGNILITTDGEPKLLDFGIAELLSPDGSQTQTRTETVVRLMTPEYASPEQACGQAVATTTDVYSLGVVLYELLTGRRPQEFKTYSPAEIERVICGQEPEPQGRCRKSVVGSRKSEDKRQKADGSRQRMKGLLMRLPASADYRLPTTDYRLPTTGLCGDLDHILLMAMRREPERRYQSVEQFSEDLRRCLAGLPVIARKDTFGYRAGKFLCRHKAGMVSLMLLVMLAVAMTIQAALIARERDRASQEAATARAVTQSLVAVFEVAEPGRGNVITARELLDRGADKVVVELKHQPVVQANLLETIGQLYQSIGLYDREQSLLEKALALRRQALGQAHPDVATSLNHLGEAARLKGDYAGSESFLREALALRRKLTGEEHRDVAESLNRLGLLLVDRGNFGEAECLLREALALRRRLCGDEHAEVAESLYSLGRLMRGTGRFREAELLYRQALAVRRKVYGAEHPLVADTLNSLAATLQEQGDLKGAEALFREALRLRRKLFGEEHPDVAVSLANLASVLQDLKQYDEAGQRYRQVLTLLHRLLGPEHPWLATTMNNLATLLRDRGDYEEADSLFRRALAMRRKLLGDAHPEVGASLHSLAVLLYLRGRYAEAEQTERQAIDICQKSLGPDHWRIQRSRSHLGACLLRLRRYREAEEQLRAGYAGLKAALGDRHAETQKAVTRLIELCEILGRTEQAGFYRALPHVSPDKSKK